MIQHDGWSLQGRINGALGKAFSSGRAIKRWWGSESGRYGTGYFYLLMMTLIALLAGYRIGQGEADRLTSTIAALTKEIQQNRSTTIDNRCFGFIDPNARDPRLWPLTPHCLAVINDTRAALGLPPVPATPAPNG